MAACATLPPPTQELSAAQLAVQRAGGADADQYAAAEVGTARTLLAQAQAAMSAGREDEARRLALLAAAEADYAHARSRDAVASANVEQRRAEIDALRRRLDAGDGR